MTGVCYIRFEKRGQSWQKTKKPPKSKIITTCEKSCRFMQSKKACFHC